MREGYYEPYIEVGRTEISCYFKSLIRQPVGGFFDGITAPIASESQLRPSPSSLAQVEMLRLDSGCGNFLIREASTGLGWPSFYSRSFSLTIIEAGPPPPPPGRFEVCVVSFASLSFIETKIRAPDRFPGQMDLSIHVRLGWGVRRDPLVRRQNA
jgi:hypothetical protein